MNVIRVKDIYPVDTISKNNDKAWTTILHSLEDTTEETELDFEGITVTEPWNNDIFKKLLAKNFIHFKFYSFETGTHTVNLLCELTGFKGERATNVRIESPKVATKEELSIQRKAVMLQELISTEDKIGILDITAKYSQLCSTDTIDGLEVAFKAESLERGTTMFILSVGGLFIQQNIIEAIALMIGRLSEQGIDLTFMSDDREIMQKIGLYQCASHKKRLTTAQKLEFLQNNIDPLTVGMLSKYKRSRAKDPFGRFGKGEVLYCRVAVYVGMTGEGENTSLVFDTYNGNTFYTQQHWMMEHDGEMLDKLATERLVVSIEEVGVFDKYIGSSYHFIMPVQGASDSGNHRVYTADSEGNTIRRDLTVPEFIKAVFDDWDIKYNEAPLLHSISETQRIIREKQK